MKIVEYHRLRVKVSLGSILILGLILAVFGTILIRDQRNQLLANLEDKGASLAETLAKNSVQHIERYSFHLLQETALTVEQLNQIAYCEFYDANGNSLVQMEASFLGQSRQKKKPVSGPDILVVKRQIVNRDVLMGHVEIGLYKNQVNQQIQERTLKLVLALLLVLGLLGLAISRFINSVLIRPLSSLVKKTQELGEGQFTQTELDLRRDEIGVLARSFNTMSRNLATLYGELNQSRETLATHNRELKRLNLLKDEFLANTSHELRTPLNGIIGIVDSMLDGVAGSMSNKQVLNLKMVLTSAKRLANLVNDILDFSKLKHKNIQLQLKPVALWSIVELVIMISEPLIKGKPLKIHNRVPEDTPPILADENRLQQILINLVANSIKFTEAGMIEVNAHTLDGMLQITVSDTGIGIPDNMLDNIFESFEQGEGDTEREYGGTGIGLALSQQLIELHGGRIWVESVVEQGSHFHFTIPTTDQTPESTEVSSNLSLMQIDEQSEEISFHDPLQVVKKGSFNVMVVDDEPINRQVLVNHLSLQNYSVTQAANGLEALEMINRNGRPDLMLVDVMMPKMSGFKLCQTLRQTYPVDELPILLLTAKSQTEDMVEGFAKGANDYLIKPFSKTELLARIHNHLQIVIAKRRTVSLRNLVSRIGQFNDTLQMIHSAYLELCSHTNITHACLFFEYKRGLFILYDWHNMELTFLNKTVNDDLLNYVFKKDTAMELACFNHLKEDDRLFFYYKDYYQNPQPGHFIYIRIPSMMGHVIVLYRNHHVPQFDSSDLEYIKSMIHEVKAAHNNIHTIRERSRMEAELTTAAAVQNALFPKTLPQYDRLQIASYFQSATETGGDWYGFITQIHDHLFVLIGDVTGHGSAAALVTAAASATCKTLEKMYAKNQFLPSPAELLSHLNQSVFETGKRKFLMTFFIADIDLVRGKVRFSNAGHTFPIWVRADGQVKRLLQSGQPLGWCMMAEYTMSTCQLEQDDILIFFTDGLTENSNAQNTMFGEKQLSKEIKVVRDLQITDIVGHMVKKGFDHYEGCPLDDDITIVGCKVTKPFDKA